jgi:four helix bundle protein
MSFVFECLTASLKLRLSYQLTLSYQIMFDFEKLDVYKRAKLFNSEIRHLIKNTKLDPTTKDQLRRASFSIVLNIAEGTGRFSNADRRKFYVISRSSVFECVAILDVLKDEGIIEQSEFSTFYAKAEEVSKMLFAMIKNLN